MSRLQTKQDKIAKGYGHVLFELAQEKKELKSVTKDLSLLETLLQKDQKAWHYLTSPITSFHIQKESIQKISSILKLSSLTQRFLLILCQNGRLQNLTAIFEVYRSKAKAADGMIEGVLESPFSLPSQEIKSFERSLEEKLGYPVTLQQEVKENLIAGVIVRVGSFMIDASLKTHLNQLQQAMKG